MTVAPERLPPKRLLIVDDEQAMHDSYARSFAATRGAEEDALGAMATELFGCDAVAAVDPVETFDCTHCHQGLDAVAAVAAALAAGAPFATAFIDIRMPPGIDGCR